MLYVITKSNFGGAQRYLYDLVTSLPSGEFDIAVALGGTGGKEATTGLLFTKLVSKGIRTTVIQHFMRDISLLEDIRALFELSKIIRKERPHVLHVMSSKAGGMGVLLGRIFRVKTIIFTSHGLAYDETWRPMIERVAIWFFTWLTILLSTKTIQITNDTCLRANTLPFCKHKNVLIHNGIRELTFIERKEAREKIARTQTNTHEVWIGTIAELTPNKNILSLIQAVQTIYSQGLHTPRLVLIGDGEQREEFREYVSKERLEHVVHMTGYLADASSYLLALDIFALPSYKEGLPYVLLEAGLASLPVVASSIPGIEDILENGVSGLLVEPTPENLALALTRLLNNQEEREGFGATLKNHVQKSFSIENMVQKTTALY